VPHVLNDWVFSNFEFKKQFLDFQIAIFLLKNCLIEYKHFFLISPDV